MVGSAGSGRFAPSPSGELHLGNLRTAMLAWLFARNQGYDFAIRIEDLDPDRSKERFVRGQMEDLQQIGIDWDHDVVVQSSRRSEHRAAIAELESQGILYRCYCTRAEIQQAASASHDTGVDRRYPGICRSLSRQQVRDYDEQGRQWCLRIRAPEAADASISFRDEILGNVHCAIDDFVIMRKDGVPAYNLAVVVDDTFQDVVQVVRADDLAESTGRQIMLQQLLGLPTPEYAHVPLLLGSDGNRLAKRHGSVTLSQLRMRGASVESARGYLAATIGLVDFGAEPEMSQLLEIFKAKGIDVAAFTNRFSEDQIP